jgi:hypothetical protein
LALVFPHDHPRGDPSELTVPDPVPPKDRRDNDVDQDIVMRERHEQQFGPELDRFSSFKR